MDKFSVAPLPAGFTLTAIIGLMLSLIWVLPQSPSWGIGMSIIFLVMLISSIVSMTYGPTEVELEYYQRVIDRAKKKKQK
ncbi:MAG: hypothetical protein QXW00_03395 [Candidatus Woesearchaeota archaeon]